MSTQAPVVDEAEYRRLLADPDMQRCLNPKCLDDVLCCYGDCPPPHSTQLEDDHMDVLTPQDRAKVDRLAGRAMSSDADRVQWAFDEAQRLAEVRPQLQEVHAGLREMAAAHAAEQPKGGTRLRFTGEQVARFEKIMGRRLERGENIVAALIAWEAETSPKLEQTKARLHELTMQATGRRLAAERRELEAAEEETYPDDFERRFGEPALLEVAGQERKLEGKRLAVRRAAPANEDEEYQRDFERRHGMKAVV